MRKLMAIALLVGGVTASGASALDVGACASVNPSSGYVGSVNRCVFGSGSRCVWYSGITVSVNSVYGCIN